MQLDGSFLDQSDNFVVSKRRILWREALWVWEQSDIMRLIQAFWVDYFIGYEFAV